MGYNSFRAFFVVVTFCLSGIIVDGQEDKLARNTLSVLPAYTYYGSIDAIHSPYRYEGKNLSVTALYTIHRNSKFYTLALSYGSLLRYPPHLKLEESILLESYDNGRGYYLWPTTASFIKKQTYWVQQSLNGYYKVRFPFASQEWYVGYFEEIDVVNCPNLPMLELFSVAIGTAIQGHILVAKNLTYQLGVNWQLLSMDIRNSYATVDGYVGEERNFSYYLDYLGRHAWLHSPWNHFTFSFHQRISYQFSPVFALQVGYQLAYRRLETPRLLKSLLTSYQLGLQYAW
ncbi:MAG: hypothetical protein WHT29_04675 [Bacteroidales bacterium]